MDIIDRPSANFNARRHGGGPDLIVVHYTAMDTEPALARLCDPMAEVSAHYLIGRTGQVWRLVEEAARAWHAGQGAWGAIDDVNSHSIGIELTNLGNEPFSDPQMSALEAMLGQIMHRWDIPPDRVIAHSDLAPERKADPGPRFDWARLARRGLSVWPEKMDAPALSFDEATHLFGYRGTPQAILDAFRLRFRPWAGGPLDRGDIEVISALATRHPCLDPGGIGS